MAEMVADLIACVVQLRASGSGVAGSDEFIARVVDRSVPALHEVRVR